MGEKGADFKSSNLGNRKSAKALSLTLFIFRSHAVRPTHTHTLSPFQLLLILVHTCLHFYQPCVPVSLNVSPAAVKVSTVYTFCTQRPFLTLIFELCVLFQLEQATLIGAVRSLNENRILKVLLDHKEL